MDPSRSISVLDRELLLVDVGGGAETHLAAVTQLGGRSADRAWQVFADVSRVTTRDMNEGAIVPRFSIR